MNVDGFGVGWYVDSRPEPVRYRRAQPLWTDASLGSLAPTIASGCILAAVRNATVGTAADESCAAPFTHGQVLFSHNGRLDDWRAAADAFHQHTVPVPDARAAVDSALLFGLLIWRLGHGEALDDALAWMVTEICRHGGGRMALLATDGTRIVGTTHRDDLYVLERPNGVLVASEPLDDDPTWWQIPPDHLVDMTVDGLRIRELELPT